MKKAICRPAELISHLPNQCLHQEGVKLASLNTNTEVKIHHALAVSMMSMHHHSIYPEPDQDKAVSFQSMKSSLEKVHGYTMLNGLHPHEKERNSCLQLDDYFEENVSKILAKRFAKFDAKNLKLAQYPLSLILVGHGAPAWFFAADEDYTQKKIGLMWCDDELQLEQLDGFTYPHLILTTDSVYFLSINKSAPTHQIKLQQLAIDQKKFVNLKNYLNPNQMKQAYQQYIPVLLPKEIERIEFLLGFRISERIAAGFRRKDFLQAEINAAEKIAAIVSQLEAKEHTTFHSIVLFSCHSADEFYHPQTGGYSISSARILSCFLADHPIVGCLGINEDVKASGLHEFGKAEALKYQLIDTLVIYQNRKVIFGPSKDFYLAESVLHHFIIDLVFANCYQKIYLLEHVLERFEQDICAKCHVNNPDHFGTAQLALISKKMQA